MSISVSVWSDVACPWCWVGKRHLEQAAKDAEVELEITWRAYELNPRASREVPENVDYIGKLARKYHTSRDGAQAMVDRMVSAGAEDGIEFRFDRIRPSNTFDAHRLLALAGSGAGQNELKERLFRAYFQEGCAMSDHATLSECASDVGLDLQRVDEVLSSDEFGEHVRQDQAEARERNITGVPFFLLADRYPIPGAQPVETMTSVLAKVVELTASSA